MRDYIALSRATDAEGVLIARPFSPLLFKLGPAPFPTLLLAFLQGKVTATDVREEWQKAETKKKEAPRQHTLKDSPWTCGVCKKEKPGSDFYAVTQSEWSQSFFSTGAGTWLLPAVPRL